MCISSIRIKIIDRCGSVIDVVITGRRGLITLCLDVGVEWKKDCGCLGGSEDERERKRERGGHWCRSVRWIP